MGGFQQLHCQAFNKIQCEPTAFLSAAGKGETIWTQLSLLCDVLRSGYSVQCSVQAGLLSFSRHMGRKECYDLSSVKASQMLTISLSYFLDLVGNVKWQRLGSKPKCKKGNWCCAQMLTKYMQTDLREVTDAHKCQLHINNWNKSDLKRNCNCS